MSTLTYTGKLVVQACCNCGMMFGVAADFDRQRRDDHGRFFCPAGHGQSYTGPSDAQRQREWGEQQRARADRLEIQLANRDEDLRSERASHELTERQRRAAKGQLTKTKKRIANGVCPCCQRSFVDLHRHMSGQHPDYAEVSHS